MSQLITSAAIVAFAVLVVAAQIVLFPFQLAYVAVCFGIYVARQNPLVFLLIVIATLALMNQ